MNPQLSNLILRTPLIPYRSMHSNLSETIFLKPENLQPFGSYKIRGVKSAIERAEFDDLRLGISAASAGNMAQAVAYWAQAQKIRCQIYVPDAAPQIKKDAILKLGAQLIERPFQEIWEMVKCPAKKREGFFVHPVFTPGLLEGYGSIADELIADLPSLDAVVIPFGVGGLTLGIARRLKKLNSDILIYACEPETASPLNESFKIGQATTVERIPSFVDAIGTPEVLPSVFEEIKNRVQASIVVSLAEVRSAQNELKSTHKLICEGAAAASLAAAKKLIAKDTSLKIACILTGGNTPLEVSAN